MMQKQIITLTIGWRDALFVVGMFFTVTQQVI
jgi:hypothetical protein